MIVYLTTNLINGKRYVGQDSRDRSYYLGSGTLLNNAIKKYEKENFHKQTLVVCKTKGELDVWEQFFIVILNTKKPNGYNLTDGGEGNTGWRPSEETRKKISEAHTGAKSPWFGKHHSEETLRKMSGIAKNRSEETRKKNSEAHKGWKNPRFGKPGTLRGKHHSEETRKKISMALMGRISSEETIRKISEANKGKHHSEESKRKMRMARMGERPSNETKRRMSENNGSKRPEVRRKISEACKGRPAWNKGKHPTKKTLQRMSEARKGQHYSPATEFKWGQVPWNKGLTREADERIKKANGIK